MLWRWARHPSLDSLSLRHPRQLFLNLGQCYFLCRRRRTGCDLYIELVFMLRCHCCHLQSLVWDSVCLFGNCRDEMTMDWRRLVVGVRIVDVGARSSQSQYTLPNEDASQHDHSRRWDSQEVLLHFFRWMMCQSPKTKSLYFGGLFWGIWCWLGGPLLCSRQGRCRVTKSPLLSSPHVQLILRSSDHRMLKFRHPSAPLCLF